MDIDVTGFPCHYDVSGDKPWDLIKVQLGSWSRAEQYISDIIEVGTIDRLVEESTINEQLKHAGGRANVKSSKRRPAYIKSFKVFGHFY
jgi:hypothetical protein